jgi:hypothetical protein
MTSGDAAPVLQVSEHDLNPVAPSVSAPAIADELAARFPIVDARAYALMVHRLAEPGGIVCPIDHRPDLYGQTAQQGIHAGVVAVLARRRGGAAISIRHLMRLSVQPARRSSNATTELAFRPLFFRPQAPSHAMAIQVGRVHPLDPLWAVFGGRTFYQLGEHPMPPHRFHQL